MADTYLTWWTSIETDLRKSLVINAMRDHGAMHSLIRTAFESGQRSATPPSPSTAPEHSQFANREHDAAFKAPFNAVDERSAFEVAFKLDQFQRRPHAVIAGDYQESSTQCAWNGWQARAALASRPAEVDYLTCDLCKGTGETKMRAVGAVWHHTCARCKGKGLAPSHTTNKDAG